MADRRRRRKLANNEDSEEGSDESEDELGGVKKSVTGSDGGDSEYESADEEELGEEEEEEDDDELILMPDGMGVPGEGDKPLDDDEDRKNPQYIPKKGTFYEHDDRTAENEGEDSKEPEEPAKAKDAAPKKKVWKEDDRWNHDKFNEYDQAPKSRDELIAIYGYDIRNEEGPPRARRRRRYGRGPNKYTRNWEDLDAYAKPVGGRGGMGRGSPRPWTGSRKTLENDEEFPALNATMGGGPPKHEEPHYKVSNAALSPRNDHPRTTMEEQGQGEVENHRPVHTPSQPHQQYQQKTSAPSPQAQDVRMEGGGRGRGGRGRGRGRGSNMDRYNEEQGYGHPGNRGGGRGNRGGYQQRGGYQGHPGRELDEITSDMKNMNVAAQNDQFRGKNRGGMVDNRRNAVPPRLQESAAVAAGQGGRGNRGGNASPGGDGSSSRPKRYSSQRQRSIPDQSVPPFSQQANYIESMEPGYQGGVYEGGSNTSSSHGTTTPHSQMPLVGGVPPTFVPPAFTSPPTFPPEPFLGRPPAPRPFPPVTQPPHLYGPPVVPPPPVVAGPPPPLGGPPPVGGPPVPPGPPVTGPPFLPPENMINYGAHPGPHPGPIPGGAPLAGPHPPQFPAFQGFTPGPVPQPGEIYSNGVTYYNTESQQHVVRVTQPLVKRPKAAIPIVPPPERHNRKADQEPAGVYYQDHESAGGIYQDQEAFSSQEESYDEVIVEQQESYDEVAEQQESYDEVTVQQQQDSSTEVEEVKEMGPSQPALTPTQSELKSEPTLAPTQPELKSEPTLTPTQPELKSEPTLAPTQPEPALAPTQPEMKSEPTLTPTQPELKSELALTPSQSSEPTPEQPRTEPLPVVQEPETESLSKPIQEEIPKESPMAPEDTLPAVTSKEILLPESIATEAKPEESPSVVSPDTAAEAKSEDSPAAATVAPDTAVAAS